MKVICTQENFSQGLQLVSHIASKNISLPILSNVLLKTEQGTLKLETTNLEIGISCQIRGKVEKEGAFTVQAKTLSDYVNLLPKENITIETTDQGVKISSANDKTVMKGLEASEFPLIPKVESGNVCKIKSGLLKEALATVAAAVSYDETRPEINGVCFKIDGENLILAATDSYRLAEKKIKISKSAASQQIIIPIRTIHELIRIITNDQEEITANISENQILFTIGAARLTSRLIEGQYPDYQQIIPREHKTMVIAETKEFINTVKRASLFCKTGSNDIMLKFIPADKEMIISAANAQIGESETKQAANIEGADNNIIFNYRYLLDGLQNINEEECVLEINTNANPGLLKPKTGEDYLYIIMPIKQ